MSVNVFKKELDNCKAAAESIEQAMASIVKDLSNMHSHPNLDDLTCAKKYPRLVLLANLLYEVQDSVTGIMNDTIENIQEEFKNES